MAARAPGARRVPKSPVDHLYRAARDGNFAEFRRLHETGVDCKADGWWGRCALWAIIKYSRLQMLEYLHAQGVRLDEKFAGSGRQPIHVAAMYGRLDCLRFLVETVGIDENAWADEEENTPFDHAVAFGHVTAAEYLREKGADVTNDDLDLSPMMHAAYYDELASIKYLYRMLGPGHAARRFSRGKTACDLAHTSSCVRYLKVDGPREWARRQARRVEAERVLTGLLKDHVPELVALVGDYVCPRAYVRQKRNSNDDDDDEAEELKAGEEWKDWAGSEDDCYSSSDSDSEEDDDPLTVYSDSEPETRRARRPEEDSEPVAKRTRSSAH